MSERQLVIEPLYTEKMAHLQEALNQYAFRVSSFANKIEIKKAVEKRFEVEVKSVKTMNLLGKKRQQMTRTGRFEGRRASWKKAIVTLKDGQSLELFGNA